MESQCTNYIKHFIHFSIINHVHCACTAGLLEADPLEKVWELDGMDDVKMAALAGLAEQQMSCEHPPNPISESPLWRGMRVAE
jgi:hypothetical protein